MKGEKMIYRAVGNRCALDPRNLKINLPKEMILSKLRAMGIILLQVNPVELARSQIGVAKYQRGARPTLAPKVMDCTSFMKWIYSQCGIWLPRYSIQQRECGRRVGLKNISAGDIIFKTGYFNYYDVNPNDGVGHAGLFTGHGTVVHAANSRLGIIESTLMDFLGNRDNFRGAIRLIPKNHAVWCLEIPPEIWVETSDDLRWLILQRLWD